MILAIGALMLGAAAELRAQGGSQVLLVVNENDAASRAIAEYYRPRRSVPVGNVCRIRASSQEEISWQEYVRDIERPIGGCLSRGGLAEKVLYIVTTLGVPLKVTGAGTKQAAEHASVDSELTLLYGKLKGAKIERGGAIPNPFFAKRDEPFQHLRFPIYLVTRLAAYDVAAVKAMIDRSLAAQNRGKFIVDLSSPGDSPGNNWLRTAAILLPPDRVELEETTRVAYDRSDVIGYASWGSNDGNRKRRMVGFRWLPGAIVMEFVSTDARTFRRPPDKWNIGPWGDPERTWAGSPQSLSADYLQEGATGCSGHVYEPFLSYCPRPEYLLPAYYQGRNLAESYYLAIPALSWQNVVLGDPLCSLGKR